MSKKLPSNLILMISGVSSVGKTTIAYNIIKKCNEFKVVTEMDIIRTVIRETILNLSDYNKYFNREVILEEYESLFESLTDGNYDNLIKQAKTLMPYVRKIIYRQQNKNIPTIIEGMSIIPEIYFENNFPIEGFKKNIVFVNLYISNKEEHLRRRLERCQERDYALNSKTILEKIEKMQSKNQLLHLSTQKISKFNTNVYSIDVTSLSINDVVDEILKILYLLFV